MSTKTQPSTCSKTDALNAEVARLVAEYTGDASPSIDPQLHLRPAVILNNEPTIVSCRVSTYIEADPGRGAFSVQLSIDDSNITTCVSLAHCSEQSLRSTALRAAEQILGDQLSQLRTSMNLNYGHPIGAKNRRKSKSAETDHLKAQRDSFWVSQVRTDGIPDFGATAWNGTYELESSAAFAEFAFNNIG